MPNQIPITRDQWLKDRRRDRLAAQVDRCNEELDRLKAMGERYSVRAGEDATELARLRGENERLRAAIEKAPHAGLCNLVGHGCNCWKRAALAGKERT